jgi:hypothetical protein
VQPFPKEAVAEILYRGLLFIRGTPGSDVERCSLEADHLHNLPGLLLEESIPLLNYYFKLERPDYLARVSGPIPPGYEAQWKIIGDFLERHPGK